MTERNSPEQPTGNSLSELLRAAAQPGSPEELQGMAAFVQQFTAEVASTTVTSRSTSMFASRITRRATAIVAVTLLAAGTAAAAAGGTDLNPFHTVEIETELETDDADGSLDDPTTTSDDESDADDDSIILSNDDSDDDDSDDADDAMHELCEDWADELAADPLDPAYADLAVGADAAGQTIDEFCVAVDAAHEANEADEDESDDDSDESDDDSDDDSDDSDDDSDDSDDDSDDSDDDDDSDDSDDDDSDDDDDDSDEDDDDDVTTTTPAG